VHGAEAGVEAGVGCDGMARGIVRTGDLLAAPA
jgi:hypothetical protein